MSERKREGKEKSRETEGKMGRRKRRMRQSLVFFPPSAGASVLGTRRRESVWRNCSKLEPQCGCGEHASAGWEAPIFFVVSRQIPRRQRDDFFAHSLPVENRDGTSAQMKTTLG